MNHRIFRVLRNLGTLLLVTGVISGSCTVGLESEEVSSGEGNGKEKKEVRLRLQVPGVSTAKTKAVDADAEDGVEDLYILAFKTAEGDNDTFEYYAKAKRSQTDKQWSALLQVREYPQNFIVIANAEGTRDDMLVNAMNTLKDAEDKTKKSIREKLLVRLTDSEETNGFNATSKDSHTPFTMCGLTESTTITSEGETTLQVNLYRIMARIQVFFGDKQGARLDNFIPQTIRLYNFNNMAQVITENPGSAAVKTTIPTHDDLKLCKAGAKHDVVDNKLEHSIYLFETSQPEDGDVHLQRPCLVVGGEYNGTLSYYRVDIGTPKGGDTGKFDYLDILRNHSYEITVKSVSGQGHGSEEEALAAKSANIIADVIPWEQSDIGNLDFDGENFLGIGTMEYRVGKNGRSRLVQKVSASEGLEWTAELLGEEGNVPDWIDFNTAEGTVKKVSGEGKGRDMAEKLEFTVSKNTKEVERKASMRFTAKNLQIDAVIIQDISNTVFIIPEQEEVEFSTDGETKQIQVEFGPENTELTWEVKKGGMTFTGTTTGTEKSGSSENKVATIDLTADKLDIEGEYGSAEGMLMLMAKSDDAGVAALNIPLYQKKYGVELSTEQINITGREQKVYVKSNIRWKVELINADDPDLQLFTNGIKSGTMGMPTDKDNDEQSCIIFNTEKPTEELNEQTALAELKFTDRYNPDRTFIKKIAFTTGVIVIDNIKYEMRGPLERSLLQIIQGVNSMGTTDEDEYKLTDRNQASSLAERYKCELWTSEMTMRCVNDDASWEEYVYEIANDDVSLRVGMKWQFSFMTTAWEEWTPPIKVMEVCVESLTEKFGNLNIGTAIGQDAFTTRQVPGNYKYKIPTGGMPAVRLTVYNNSTHRNTYGEVGMSFNDFVLNMEANNVFATEQFKVTPQYYEIKKELEKIKKKAYYLKRIR